MAPMPAGHVADQLMRYLTGARWFAGKGRPNPLAHPAAGSAPPAHGRRSGSKSPKWVTSEILDQ